MQLISVWLHLSEVRMEEFMKDSISFTAFYGLEMEHAIPDYRMLSRFCSELTAKKLDESVMDEVSWQLTEKNANVKSQSFKSKRVIMRNNKKIIPTQIMKPASSKNGKRRTLGTSGISLRLRKA
ncbi:MAG: transposase [Flavobacteriaceae bacterium]|nr:transposase [Flavobacteriaceae bacterium]MCY4267898.1 transposase [Flavobacteriaceae bacterium]MCY4298805.1 transposase [Flavobacteriaceae bacterium]